MSSWKFLAPSTIGLCLVLTLGLNGADWLGKCLEDEYDTTPSAAEHVPNQVCSGFSNCPTWDPVSCTEFASTCPDGTTASVAFDQRNITYGDCTNYTGGDCYECDNERLVCFVEYEYAVIDEGVCKQRCSEPNPGTDLANGDNRCKP